MGIGSPRDLARKNDAAESLMARLQLSDEKVSQTLEYVGFNKNRGDDEDSTHQDTETTSFVIAPSNTHIPESVEGYR